MSVDVSVLSYKSSLNVSVDHESVNKLNEGVNKLNESISHQSIADKVMISNHSSVVKQKIDKEVENILKENSQVKQIATELSLIEIKKQSYQRYNSWRQDRINNQHEISILQKNALKKLDFTIKNSHEINKFIVNFFKQHQIIQQKNLQNLQNNRNKQQNKLTIKTQFYETFDNFLVKMNQGMDISVCELLENVNFISNNILTKLDQEKKEYQAYIQEMNKKITLKSKSVREKEKIVMKFNSKFTENFIQMVKTQTSKLDYYMDQKLLIDQQKLFDKQIYDLSKGVLEYYSQLEKIEQKRIDLYKCIYTEYLEKQSYVFGASTQLQQLSELLGTTDPSTELSRFQELLCSQDKARLETQDLEDFSQQDLIRAQLTVDRDVATLSVNFKPTLLTFTLDGNIFLADPKDYKVFKKISSLNLQLIPKKNRPSIYDMLASTKGFFGGDTIVKMVIRINQQTTADQIYQLIDEHKK